ncbi:MAG: peptidoglycan DD-metalloendopeptidase family protein [Henriciella sp.]|jgi:murein DD-endopeptidase MepM/ murein hydrolase activator NlpD
MKTTAKVSDFVRKAFPERQIYHRSGGTVRYFTISPLQQIMLSCAVAAIVGWSIFASANVILGGKSQSGTVATSEVSKLERWVQELRAKEALSTGQLIQRTEAFQDATQDFQRRHETLSTMLYALKNGGELEVSALRGNSASLLVTASIDEADARQSQRLIQVADALPQVGLSGQVSQIRTEQELFLDDIEDMAVERAEAARGVLRLTKVGANRITSGENMGGPEITFASLISGEFENPEEEQFAVRVAQVAARMEEARYFESLVRKLPLATPIGVPSRVTSNFGMRTDPFKKTSGWHGGLDMGAGWNAPIVAAGPGTVIFAGTKSGYGRVVDVDHGQGFVSRYAHLNKVIAKRGQTVAIGDKLGLMGSTGRSTGPHLHYEVLFHGKQYNPVEFIKAGKHVHED